jgi:hypothetical protein
MHWHRTKPGTAKLRTNERIGYDDRSDRDQRSDWRVKFKMPAKLQLMRMPDTFFVDATNQRISPGKRRNAISWITGIFYVKNGLSRQT